VKGIIKKYRDLVEKLEKDASLNKSTKDNIKRCMAIYVNGEILKAFDAYIRRPNVVITPDMIAFFYLHIQMSGAANECLSRSYTDACPELRGVLFDETSDGKGAPRLLRFAGAHSESLAGLLNGFTPRLLRDYIDIIEEILPVIKKDILTRIPSLTTELNRAVAIDFSPMQPVEFSSPKFTLTTQKANTRRILESLKVIDIIEPILKQHTEFYNSDTGQSLVIMARQIFANNIHELQNDNDIYVSLKSWAQNNNASLAELRQYRNKSSHGFVLWEIQHNPIKLRFNCIRLVVNMRGELLEHLATMSPGGHAVYLNKPALENKVREEDCVLTYTAAKNKLPPLTKKTKVRTKQADLKDPDFDDDALFDKQVQQDKMMKGLIAKLAKFCDSYIYKSRLREDPIELFATVIPELEKIYEVIPGKAIKGINIPLIAHMKERQALVQDDNGVQYWKCYMEASIGFQVDYQGCMLAKTTSYPFGFDKGVELYFIGMLFRMFASEVDLFKSPENLSLFNQTIQRAIDLGTSVNSLIQISTGLTDVLSYAVAANLPKEVIVLLLENGAKVTQVLENQTQIGVLHYSARLRPDILPLILQQGANPLDAFYDPGELVAVTSSIFYDVFASYDCPLKSRMKSLEILYPYIYQKYGGEALLANMSFPIIYHGDPESLKRVKWDAIHTMDIYFKAILSIREESFEFFEKVPGAGNNIASIQYSFTGGLRVKQNDVQRRQLLKTKLAATVPCLILHQKVETVLSNPKYSFYRLILNDEIEIMVQEIARLNLPNAILEAMGIDGDKTETHNGKQFTAVEFALDLGLMPLALYLGRVRAFCQAPSVVRCSDMASYFFIMETCLYNVLNANFTFKYNSESSVFNIIGDYWGRGVEHQNVAHHCL